MNNKDMMLILRQLGTGKDGMTHDVFRWLAVLTVFVTLGLTIFVVVWRSKDFDIQAFGIGISSIFVAVGAALKLKETTEPDVPPPKDRAETNLM